MVFRELSVHHQDRPLSPSHGTRSGDFTGRNGQDRRPHAEDGSLASFRHYRRENAATARTDRQSLCSSTAAGTLVDRLRRRVLPADAAVVRSDFPEKPSQWYLEQVVGGDPAHSVSVLPVGRCLRYYRRICAFEARDLKLWISAARYGAHLRTRGLFRLSLVVGSRVLQSGSGASGACARIDCGFDGTGADRLGVVERLSSLRQSGPSSARSSATVTKRLYKCCPIEGTNGGQQSRWR